MLRIGDFSKLSQVSIKTLHHYDQLGLLKPIKVDEATNYRYYSVDQLPRLNRILAYKDLGFSLEQIDTLLDEDLPVAQIRGMLRLKQAEIQRLVTNEKDRLKRIEFRLRQIDQENDMPTQDVVIKHVHTQKVVAIRANVPTYGDQHILWNELGTYLAQKGIKPCGPCLTIYHDPEYREQDVDIEVCEPIKNTLPTHERIIVRELPEIETMACLIHEGSYENFNQTYEALVRWIETNGYQIVGPNREVYLRNVEHTNNPDEYLTEIQFPVTKARA